MSKVNSNLFREDPAAYYTELGAKAERERIIKLLEDSEVRAKWIEATSKSLPTYQGVVDFFTSLIKGKQK